MKKTKSIEQAFNRQQKRQTQPQLTFETTKKDAVLIHRIAVRASKCEAELGLERAVLDIDMDVTACHANGCPLDLKRLLFASDFNFLHDIEGIHRHLDRTTGKLKNCFLPRFACK
jgi:hypothetical protein